MLPRKVYSLIQKIDEHMPHGKPVSEILMFHEVYGPMESAWDTQCAVSSARFKALLDALPAGRVGTPEHLSQKGTVLLTFDDIFVSAYRNAVPTLRERNLPYTVFIAPGLLGKDNYITLDHLRDLAKDPLCTVGAHTMHHEKLRFQSDSLVQRELTDSKAYLEDILGRQVDNFAFPFGSIFACSPGNIKQVASCGFRRGFSTLNRSVTASDLTEPWFLPRRNINDLILQMKGF